MARRTETTPDAVRTMLRSGLVDPGFVGAQVGEDGLSPADAAAVALSRDDVSPHPLFEPEWLARRRLRLRSGLSPVSWYVSDHEIRTTLAPHPLVDPRLIVEHDAAAASHPHGPLAHWLERAEDSIPLPNRFLTEELTWGAWREASLAAARAWRTQPPGVPEPDWRQAARQGHDGARSSVVLGLGTGPRRAVEWLAALPRDGVQVITVGVGASRAQQLLSRALAGALPRVDHVDLPHGCTHSAAMNAGVVQATGATVVLVRPEVEPPRRDLTAPLAHALADTGVGAVQPLVLADDGAVASAGAWQPQPGEVPVPFLAGHARADAEALGRTPVAAMWSPVVAARTADVIGLGGLTDHLGPEWSETDLGSRMQQARLGQPVLVPDVHVTAPTPTQGLPPVDTPVTEPVERLRSAGLAVSGGRMRRLDGLVEHPPRLRWAIDIAAPAAPRGDLWGDTYFAASLAAALQAQGQHVAVDRRDARNRATRDLDDVVLVIRGLDAVVPRRPGPLSLLWVISHPDQVTAEEAARHDLAYAASLTWARQVSRDWDVRVQPLMQCTDESLFGPRPSEADSGPEVLFVGNSRGMLRPVVSNALDAGLPLTLYGRDWAALLPPGQVVRPPVPNSEVGALYASASVVLNDHHEDMAREGFVSNRVFDALACGARVVSDPVAGLDQLFGNAVATFEDEKGLAELCRAPYPAFGSLDDRLALAEQVRTQHTFTARARRLVDDAVRELRARRS